MLNIYHSKLINEMRKKILLVLLLLSVFIQMGAQTRIRLGHNSGTTSDPTGIGEQNMPAFYAEYDDECLTLTVENYVGNTTVMLMGSTGHTVVYESAEYISSFSPLNIDISSYVSGTYTIYVFTEDKIYSGEIELE